jgi:hypothetical protein
MLKPFTVTDLTALEARRNEDIFPRPGGFSAKQPDRSGRETAPLYISILARVMSSGGIGFNSFIDWLIALVLQTLDVLDIKNNYHQD